MTESIKAADRWMTAKEAAEYTRLALQTIHNKVHQEEIPYHRRGRIVRFRQSELDAWLRGEDVGGDGGGAA